MRQVDEISYKEEESFSIRSPIEIASSQSMESFLSDSAYKDAKK